jgi:hypothetical protein
MDLFQNSHDFVKFFDKSWTFGRNLVPSLSEELFAHFLVLDHFGNSFVFMKKSFDGPFSFSKDMHGTTNISISSWNSFQKIFGTSSDSDSKASGQPFKVFLAGWLNRFENLLKTENPFVAMRQARFRAKNLLKRIPRGNGNVRRAMHILREGKWAVKGFLHEHKGIAKMVKNKKMSKELLTERWNQISAKRPGLVKKLDKVMAVLKEIHQNISECEFILDSDNSSSESSDVRGHGHWKKHWKGDKHGPHGFNKGHFKAKMQALKAWKNNMSKDEWKEKKEEWKAKKQMWKAKKQEWKQGWKDQKKAGCWAKKQKWFKNKIESKVQE